MRRQQLLIHLFKAGRQRCQDKVHQAELTIYNYIIENCVYSTQADNCQSAYGALIDGQAK